MEELLAVIGELRTALTGLVNVITPFVEAIAPSVVQELNQAFRDLNATIGVAFIGVINVVSSAVREFAGIILPLTRELGPIFTQLANTIADILLPVIRLVILPFQLLAPILDVVVGLMNEWAKYSSDLIAVFTAVATAVKTAIESIFGTDASGLKEIFKGFFDIMRQVVKALVTFAAVLAVAAGGAGLVRGFADALDAEARARDERAAGLKAAGTNPAILDVAAIARQAQLAAFVAAGGGGAREKTDTEWLKDIGGDLRKIAADNRPLADVLTTWWQEQVVDGIGGRIERLLDSLYTNTVGFFDRVRRKFPGM